MKEVSARKLTSYYLIALAIIAGLSVFFHFVVEYELRISRSSSAVINLSGKQRMLSQRIASMAAQYSLGVPGAREDLIAAAEAFEKAHQQLLSEINGSTGTDQETLALRSKYESGPASLDIATRRYIATARRIAATPPRDPAMAGLLTALFAESRTTLLNDLDNVVSIRQQGAEARIYRLQWIQLGILTIVLITLVVETFTIFQPMVRKIVAYNAELTMLAATDPLTGAANRRSFMESAESEFGRHQRYERTMSLLAIDVDHFKAINDTYGHAAGDQVLVDLAAELMQRLRSIDVLGRIGGEEFAVLLPETAIAPAKYVAERLREAVANMDVRHEDKLLKLTVSIGVVEVSPSMTSFADVMSSADAAMYRAKEAGRNRVVVEAVPA